MQRHKSGLTLKKIYSNQRGLHFASSTTVLIAEAVSLSFHIQSVEQCNLNSWLRIDQGSKTHLGRIFCVWLRIMCMVMCGKWVLHRFEITRENVYMWFACHHILVVNGHLTFSSHFLQLEYWCWHVPFRNAWISKTKRKEKGFPWFVLSLFFGKCYAPFFILKSYFEIYDKVVTNLHNFGRNENMEF